MDLVWLWILFAAITVPIAWLALSLALSQILPPEKSGRDYLKRRVKKCGIDVRSIPEAVFDEIVAHEIPGAKILAKVGRPEWNNWRANLVRSLDEQALHIARLMNGERGWGGSAIARDALAKHGVIKGE